MTGVDTLEPELVWQEDGHLGDVAIGALADGELDLLPATARDHAAVCDACSARVGQAAMSALALDEALASRRAPAPARIPLPIGALAVALALALVGLLPRIGSLADRAVTLARLVGSDLPLLARTVALLARSVETRMASTWPFVWLAASMVLFVVGLLVARLAPRSTPENGGS